ncbi:MAG: response regulator transcription factor [Clostridiales bacterium]|nr:response regulator transcription factor [Clostridiales bacterium]
MRKSILIIDDDKELGEITSDMLEEYGYEVTRVLDSNGAYEELSHNVFHLILLDINLPFETGFEVCKEIRKVSSVPIIFASARTAETDRIEGLDIGGDDYISKPYSLKELLSRINALVRRTYSYNEESDIIKIGNIEIDEGSRLVKKDGKEVSLSLKEFDLLLYLAKNKNKTLKKEEILKAVWGTFSDVELSTVAVHIRWLREKLEEDPSNPLIIKTAWGIGYTLTNKGQEK